MDINLPVGAATCSKGFVNSFLRVPQAVGLYCSCHAAQASKGNFKKTYYKTFRASGRPTQYSAFHPVIHMVLKMRIWGIHPACGPLLQLPTAQESPCKSHIITKRNMANEWMKTAVLQCIHTEPLSELNHYTWNQ